jgi:transcriptional regulator with XRE-family HTH domain
MARNWKEVRKNLGPEREARIKRRVRDEIAHLSLIQLREARNLTQVSLAELLGIPKGGVSRLERRTDMYVSTLRNLHSRDGRRAHDYCGVSEWGNEISQFEEQKNS